MKPPRSAPIAFRFDPAAKAALKLIADMDGRSMANMMEWLIRKHCEKESLGWPPVASQPAARPEPPKKPAAKKAVAKRSSSKLKQGTKQ